MQPPELSQSVFHHPAPSRWPMALVLTSAILVSGLLLVLYVSPDWAARWRWASDQAAADAVYARRQAELKAEAEAADERLAALDRRVQLVSLGFREVARKVTPVVVHIGNEVEVGEHILGSFYDFDTNRHYQERAEGSGILVPHGYVLTNEHVVRDAQRLRITFASGRWLTIPARKVAADRLTDLAIIQLPAEPGAVFKQDLEITAEFADSDHDVQVGDWVLAAGSPFGLKQTLTAGIISAKGRVELGILNHAELLQTDAAINPGNSGGPLFDQRGRVVGINVAIASKNGVNQGVGFAIPSNTAKEIFEQLAKDGEVQRGFLGVLMQEVPPGLGTRLGVGETGGVIVSGVEPNSPADKAGLRKGDVIVRYGNEAVGTVNPLNNLRQRIARTPPDTTVPIEILRRNRQMKIDVDLIKRPAIP